MKKEYLDEETHTIIKKITKLSNILKVINIYFEFLKVKQFSFSLQL